MLTWPVVIALAVGVYAQRASGAVFVRADRMSPGVRKVLDALPLAVSAGVVALTTVTGDGALQIDARLAGVAVAGWCAHRRMPMLVAVVAAAAATAILRALT